MEANMERSGEFPTAEKIQATDEFFDLIQICEDFIVSYDELETAEEIRERLLLERDRRNGVKHKTQIQNTMQKTEIECKKKRSQLIEMFEELVQIIGEAEDTKKAELIQELLQKEQTSQNLQEDCRTRVERLRNQDCYIVVAGETGAGKSTFLNLLLGEDFLPRHALSCTSVITTVRYAQRPSANITYGEPNSRVEVIKELDEAGKERLYEVAFMRNQEMRTGHDIQEVQVFLPVDFLKCGIVLVDTTGVGENEFLEQYVLDFISRHEILGFLYIIQSDAAGGVQEDRLLKMIKMIIEQQKQNNRALEFDPKSALFVANKFDSIPDIDKNKVKEHILQTLRKYWPEFEDSTTVFFSAKKALQDIKAHPDYINNNYKKLLESLCKLHSHATDRRIRSSYKWIEAVMKRISHFLKVTLTRLGSIKRENQNRSSEQRKKLQRLQESSNTVITELAAALDEKCHEIVMEFQRHLLAPHTRYLLCSRFGKDMISHVQGNGRHDAHWKWLKDNIEDAFYDRLCNEVEEYNTERGNVSKIETEIFEMMKSKLGLLQNEVRAVESDISATRVSNTSNDIDPFRRRYIYISSLPLEVSPKLSFAVQSRVSRNLLERFWKPDKKEYQRNPQAWAKARAEKLLVKLTKNKRSKNKEEEGMLTSLVRTLLQRPYQVLQAVRQKIPNIIESNLRLLHEIEHNILTDGRKAAHYEQMAVQVERLKTLLINYGAGYIFVHDFKAYEIKLLQQAPAGNSIASTYIRVSEIVSGDSKAKSSLSSDYQGLWTIVRRGTLQRQGQETPISIKMYMPNCGLTHWFQEVAKLRCLLNEKGNLAKFLGIHNTEAAIQAHVFQGHLLTVERFMLACIHPDQHLERIIKQTAEGVYYLHSKGMVHMELTSSTVSVTEDGEVRLTGACMPRHAGLPLDLEQPVSGFIYLPPEVLNKELYVTSADVYGFGLLVFELTGQRKAFQDQRSYSFKDFINKLNPCAMLQLDTQTWLSPNALNLVKQCVEVSENRRPNMDVVMQLLDTLNGKFKVEATERRPSNALSPRNREI